MRASLLTRKADRRSAVPLEPGKAIAVPAMATPKQPVA